MIGCGRCMMGHLGQAELRALRVIADAGLVPPLAVLADSGSRTWIFPDTKAS
jgi:hypothetical protein